MAQNRLINFAKLIALAIGGTVLLTPTAAATAPSPTPEPIVQVVAPTLSTKEEMQDYAREVARGKGLNADHFIAVISCETSGKWEPTMQSGYFNPRYQARERSFGLAQIHLPDHPTLSWEEATDPKFAIDWMAAEWAADREWQWTCYRTLAARGWV